MTEDQGSGRSRAPVFVLGCPRSGTTLLYDMLLSAGGFAVYLAESNVFNVLALRYGDLSVRRNRQKLLRVWLNTKLFRATGLNSQAIERKVLEECTNSADFLRIVMDEIASEQGMQRWAENSPEAILHLPLIKELIPDALVIHIIRDGRDVAMSLARVRYVRPLPWQDRQSLVAAGTYWQWVVERGRNYGRLLGPSYMEVRFEDLIGSPVETLSKIGEFIDHELYYEQILRVAYGSVRKPNTSFTNDPSDKDFNPIGRWRSLPAKQLQRLERIVGNTLRELGYSPTTSEGISLGLRVTRFIYRIYFEAKLWFKQNPLVRVLRPKLSAAEIDASVLAEDCPPEVRAVVSELPR